MEKTRVLLTGAAGTVGKEVLAQLCAQASVFDITTFEQDTPAARRALAPFGETITSHFGDITQPAQIARACENMQAVIHLAAVIPPAADKNPALAQRVNVDGTDNLITAIRAASPDAFLIYASSISVYGDRVNTPHIRVGDACTPSQGDEYAATKIAAEVRVRNSGLSWSIFRLTAVMGGHMISPLMFHMPLKTVMEIASPGDAARAFVNAISQRRRLSGRIFNLGGGPACRIRYQDFLERSFRIAGLGALDFPGGAFATRNFHCGAYADGDDLEDILHFRQDTLEEYFTGFRRATPGWKSTLTCLLRRPIKARLLRQSEPWRAWRTKGKLFQRFFCPQTKKAPV